MSEEEKESNKGYVLGQDLKRGTIQAKEFVLLLENLLNTEFLTKKLYRE